MEGAFYRITNDHEKSEFLQDFNGKEYPIFVQFAQPKTKSSRPMKGTWRMWMAETAEWMAARGAIMPLFWNETGAPVGSRPYNASDAHESFMRHWGGVDDNGERERQEKAGKGAMLYIMNKHQEWAAEKGIALTIPRDGEYMELMREANS